ncbi:MAG: sugar phosphate nucleotidyltransferase [Candidatus Bathyarchaeota archaeon]|nr:sugar phosphate nucleotidyltransferase [Candidatus Bathyarchaeota archaeon]
MKAVVLAAGEGQRLRPLTFTRPKHMIQIGGKPLLEHTIVALREAGAKDILIVVHYKAEQIRDYFGDGSNLHVNISYVLQKEVMGTANAFAFAEDHVNGDFIALYGDLLTTSKGIRSAVNLHSKAKASATLTTLHVEKPEYYGIIKTEGDKVTEIVEKPTPEAAADNPINAGVYVFSTDIFEAIRRTKASPRGEEEITDSIRMLIEDGKNVVAAKILSEDWLDIGRPWDLLEANARVLMKMKPEVLGQVEEGAHLGGPVFVGKDARIRSGAYIEGPVYIGEGSIVGPNCLVRGCTSIGKNVYVGNACEVKNSIIMDCAGVHHLSYVGDSVIGENSNLGAGTITSNFRFDAKPVKMQVKGEIVNTGRNKIGAIMGDNVKTGVGSLFMPGVKVGCNSWVGPNLVVTRDVPSDTFLILRQQVERTSR